MEEAHACQGMARFVSEEVFFGFRRTTSTPQRSGTQPERCSLPSVSIPRSGTLTILRISCVPFRALETYEVLVGTSRSNIPGSSNAQQHMRVLAKWALDSARRVSAACRFHHPNLGNPTWCRTELTRETSQSTARLVSQVLIGPDVVDR